MLLLVGITLFLPLKYNSISILILIVHCLFYVPRKEKTESFKKNWKLILLLSSFYLITAISITYSENQNEAWKDIEQKLSLLLFPLVLLLQKRISLKELDKILYYFSVSAVVFSLLALIISLVEHSAIPANQELAGSIGMHASYMGLYVAFGFFIILERSLKKTFSFQNIILQLILLFMIAFLASRIIALASLIIAIVWFVILNYRTKYLLSIIVIAALVAVISYFSPPIKNRFYEAINIEDQVVLDQKTSEVETDFRNAYGGRALRMAIWKCSWDVLSKNWLFGVGTGDDHAAIQQSYKDRNFVFAWKYNSYNAHNLFLQTVIASGILALLALLAIFIYFIYYSLKFKMLNLFAFVLLFFSISMVETSLNVQKGIVFFALFTSIFASFIQGRKNKEGLVLGS